MTAPRGAVPAGEASPWLVRFLPLAPPGGSALDLAAGGGRNSRLLLARGMSVTAVDRDVSRLAELAAAPRFEAIAADLEDGAPWPLAGRRFDLVVVANYLHRPLFEPLRQSLAAGGVLIYDGFAAGNERFGRPRNPDFLLRPGELIQVFAGPLRLVAFEQGLQSRPRPAVRQRLVAAAPRPNAP